MTDDTNQTGARGLTVAELLAFHKSHFGDSTMENEGGATTATPATVAAAAANATSGDNGTNGPEAAATKGAEPGKGTERLPDDHPLVTALARQKAENDSLKEKARRLDQFEESQKTETEKLTDRLTNAEDEVKQIPTKVADALRSHLVGLHGISDEDAELFLTATDPEVLLKQATRYVERNKPASGYVPTQGTASPNGTQVSAYELGRERAKARYQKN